MVSNYIHSIYKVSLCVSIVSLEDECQRERGRKSL